ncbi:NAD(P)/FAD-dependent oxidoreductase [Gordonia aurantiaca]|uniref:NAD(P)/FAD-dependent oxidoreductase n=1 Tax=Gordonia sp. B21 TaxID=3151852 RepID=UPI0032679306
MDRVECLVVGGGIVGLAVARALALTGREVVVLEAADAVGTQTTSRSSEVIHAGIYYPEGSLKARLCVRGREMLTRYCDEHGVAWRRPGKLIVATDDAQSGRLETLLRHGLANGVEDLRRVDESELHELEPEVWGVGALLSPSTGIVDVAGMVRALQRDVEDLGGAVALRSRVVGGRVDDAGVTLELADGSAASADLVVNCAGLGAWSVAESLVGFDGPVPQRHLAKGNYFGLTGARAPFEHLVYPVPVDGGLGVHFTMDLDGAARFGPDVEWIDGDAEDLDHRVDEGRRTVFEEAIRRYWPGLPDQTLTPAYAGIRPKVGGPGEAAADFVIQGPNEHGSPGLVNLFGIESPGITSSLAIGGYVAESFSPLTH